MSIRSLLPGRQPHQQSPRSRSVTPITVAEVVTADVKSQSLFHARRPSFSRMNTWGPVNRPFRA